jgi:hypothetical protein
MKQYDLIGVTTSENSFEIALSSFRGIISMNIQVINKYPGTIDLCHDSKGDAGTSRTLRQII